MSDTQIDRLTVVDVIARVEDIRKMADDDEAAHGSEDGLYERVLQAIADGTCEDPAVCAREALKTRDINFARWCA